MGALAYYNGFLGEKEDVKISLYDRALYFGDGIYDAAIGRGNKIYLLDEHLRRFFLNAEKIGIETDLQKNELSKILCEIVEKASLPEFFLYFQLSRSFDTRKHSAKGVKKSNLLITVEPMSLPSPSRGLRLITYDDLRYYYCDIKTLNLLPSVLASTKADLLGCDEAVFHRGDVVTECAKSNIFILKNGVLKTHPQNNLILSGITRKHLLWVARKLGISTVESPFSLSEMLSADEVIITSTTKLAMRAVSIDGVACGMKDCKTFALLSAVMRENFEKEVGYL